MAVVDVEVEHVPMFLALCPRTTPVIGTLNSETRGVCRFLVEALPLFDVGDRLIMVVHEEPGQRRIELVKP